MARWGWRLFRREWRQQLLVLGLLTVAVAATIWAVGVVTNAQLRNPNWATYGTAAATGTLPGSDPHLAADIAAIQRSWGPADVIENKDITTGTTQSVYLRAENPHGLYNSPLLGLVSGTYPAGPGQVALTTQVATLYDAHVGGTWQAAGTTWRVTGIAQNPSNLRDEFALVAPGQVVTPGQVVMLLGSSAVRHAIGNSGSGPASLAGKPADATVSVPTMSVGAIPPATIVLVVAVVGLVFIGLLAVAGFSVMAQRGLRALGMLSAIGATERNVRLVMIVNGAVVGVVAALAGGCWASPPGSPTRPRSSRTLATWSTRRICRGGRSPRGSCCRSRHPCSPPAARPRPWPACRSWPRCPVGPLHPKRCTAPPHPESSCSHSALSAWP